MAVGIGCLIIALWLFFADWYWRRNARRVRNAELSEDAGPVPLGAGAPRAPQNPGAPPAPAARYLAIVFAVLGVTFVVSKIF
jgi:hypothetical protein